MNPPPVVTGPGTLTWNTFPVPSLKPSERQAIALAGKAVEAARDLHPERSLAVAYDPLAMDPKLIKAHDDLDRSVDKAFGAAKRLSNNVQRFDLTEFIARDNARNPA